MVTTQTQPKVKRHPIRGALWGLLGGFGVALILFNFGVITLPRQGWLWWVVVIVGFVVLGILWGMFGPAKKPKGEPPPAATVGEAPAATAEPEPVTSPPEPAGDDSPSPDDDEAG